METSGLILTIIGTVVGSTGLWELIKFLISRKDNKNGELTEIKKQLEEIRKEQTKSEKDSCRTQLLLLIKDYPDDKQEIMRIAEHYFKVLQANWYLTSIFNTWLQEHDVAEPEWFHSKEE